MEVENLTFHPGTMLSRHHPRRAFLASVVFPNPPGPVIAISPACPSNCSILRDDIGPQLLRIYQSKRAGCVVLRFRFVQRAAKVDREATRQSQASTRKLLQLRPWRTRRSIFFRCADLLRARFNPVRHRYLALRTWHNSGRWNECLSLRENSTM
jgi:hypothetical protein